MKPTAAAGRAIGYIRFSSDSQADGSSIERQTDNIKAYCQRTGLTLVDTLIDNGLSGFRGKHISRGKLGVFLNEVDNGKHQGTALVVEQMDRLSRQGIMQTGDLLERLLKGGVEVHVNGRVIRDLEGLETGIMNLVESWTAREYSKKLQERVIKGKRERRAKFLKGELSVLSELLPLWLEKRDGKVCSVKSAHGKGKSRKVPARLVAQIFEMAAEGKGAPKIKEALNGRGAGLNQVWITKTLSNRAVLGEFISKGETLHDYYPRIIDETLWQAARRAIDSRNRMTGEQRKRCVLGRCSDDNLFTGLLHDITTPGKEFSVWFEKRGSQGTFLATSRAEAGPGELHRIRYSVFENAFARYVTELDWAEIISKGEPAELSSKLEELAEFTNEEADKRRMAESRKSLMNRERDPAKLDLWANDYLQFRTEADQAKERREAVSIEINTIRATLANLENPQVLVDLMADRSNVEIRAKLKAEISKRIAKIGLIFSPSKTFTLFGVNFVNGVIGVGIIAADGNVKLLRLTPQGEDFRLSVTEVFKVA